MKCDKSLILKLKDGLFRYNEEENSSDVLAVKNAILIAKLCIHKCWGTFWSIASIWNIIKFQKRIIKDPSRWIVSISS